MTLLRKYNACRSSVSNAIPSRRAWASRSLARRPCPWKAYTAEGGIFVERRARQVHDPVVGRLGQTYGVFGGTVRTGDERPLVEDVQAVGVEAAGVVEAQPGARAAGGQRKVQAAGARLPRRFPCAVGHAPGAVQGTVHVDEDEPDHGT